MIFCVSLGGEAELCDEVSGILNESLLGDYKIYQRCTSVTVNSFRAGNGHKNEQQ
jgi:hypothetical protein